MDAKASTFQKRARLGVLAAPGVLAVCLGFAAYLYGRARPDFDFGKRRLLATAIAGMAVLAVGLFIHRKASQDAGAVNRPYWATVLFCALCLTAGPLLTVFAVDKAIGAYLSTIPPRPLLVMRPSSRDSFRTTEFTFTATTNSLGFRDRELDLRRKTDARILALGDSFTYGWGVNDDEPWPKVLERILSKEGRTIEVLNFGCPGAGVDAYAKIAESVIPIAKPDIVLVAVLQGIDLKLSDLGSTADRLFQSKADLSGRPDRSLAARTVPNLGQLCVDIAARRPVAVSADEHRRDWQAKATTMSNQFTPEQAERFEKLDDEVKAMFRDGDLNPWEVLFALKYPDYVSFTLDGDRAAVRRATEAMGRNLESIKRLADANNARLIALSVPPAWYYSARALAAKRRVGYRLDDSALGSDVPGRVVCSACRDAGVDCVSFVSRVRRRVPTEPWYFDLDGMYNATGHAFFGEAVADELRRRLQ
jgi:hypothetical protein